MASEVPRRSASSLAGQCSGSVRRQAALDAYNRAQNDESLTLNPVADAGRRLRIQELASLVAPKRADDVSRLAVRPGGSDDLRSDQTVQAISTPALGHNPAEVPVQQRDRLSAAHRATP